MCTWLKVERHEVNQTFFTKNGGALLEELISFCDGRSNPICHFSATELLTATNYYDKRQIFMEDAGYQLFKGSLKDRPIFVKKYDSCYRLGHHAINPYKDIVIGSQMSVHKNVLKVIGCCLETEIPSIVYEFVDAKRLSTCISATNDEPLPWKCRLKVAIGIASEIAYLHTAFSRPVIHRNIKCSNIILDQNNVPKLIHFGLCISIPEEESHVLDAIVSMSNTQWLPPEYCGSAYITEKVDVYLFGELLIELLSGEKPSDSFMRYVIMEGEIETIINVVDIRIKNEGIDGKQLPDFAKLILRCTSYDEEKRPTMIEVAKELRLIDQSFPSPS